MKYWTTNLCGTVAQIQTHSAMLFANLSIVSEVAKYPIFQTVSGKLEKLMYLGYFENEENTEGDHPPIGIVLAKEKDELLVKYAMHNISSQLFVSKYQLYLPNREELQALISQQINRRDI
jgi:hypothetical protein